MVWFKRKELAFLGAILTVSFFCLAFIMIAAAFQFYQAGVVDVLSIIGGLVVAPSCLVSFYVTTRLIKTKISKETYYYMLLVLSFSALSHVTVNLIFKLNFPYQWLVTISIVIATPLSCLRAGYSRRTLKQKIRKLGLNQGITLFTLLVLFSLPIIEILPMVASKAISTSGRIVYSDVIFESADDTARVQGEITGSVFTAEVPIRSDTVFSVRQAVNITNSSPWSLDVRIFLEVLSGNLSKVKQLKIFLTLTNATVIPILDINDNMISCEEINMKMTGLTTVTLGVTTLARNSFASDITQAHLALRRNERTFSISIGID